MPKNYTEELVHIKSEDGIELEGLVIRPANGETKPIPVVWNHGFTGRFYEPHAVAIGRYLAGKGFTFVTGNNRGRDFGSILRKRESGEESVGGAAWENLTESPRDLGAWITFTVGLGFPQVALLGHSLGGMKATYYMATSQDPRVKALINASGPIWRFIGPAREQVDGQIEEACHLVAEGRGLEVLQPKPGVAGRGVSAQRIANAVAFNEVLFGTATNAPAAAFVKVPFFAFIGTEEEWIGTAKDLEALREVAIATPRLETQIFAGADHCYVGKETEVAQAIAEFVDSL
jgi:pimeloyl-ACP methyl ester carboxylesterase